MTHLRVVREWTPEDGHKAIADAIVLAAFAAWAENTLKTGLESVSRWLAAHSTDFSPPGLLPPSTRHAGPSTAEAARTQVDREPWRQGRKAQSSPTLARNRQRRLR